jgi:hypothetical protein
LVRWLWRGGEGFVDLQLLKRKGDSWRSAIAIPPITTFPIFFPKDCLGACSCLLFCGSPLRKAPSRTMTASI